ncbi:hypothetical protein DIU31_028020 [Mucilaginibacter rubeus]|uniref:Antibiotic biosynthesis monooxygenase n=1 Tax=Mucilaginibacter rubeus TaxID=2027860 RepID=A0AAE6MKY4_9SPHI|nr:MULTISPECIES: antibiotic biosynthesis monooxygenase [Mucilaginibacter]QEM07161.1 hypothetical protein DIU31_028020 [Mucilaginibacter rubeus]QEM19615.1 hypothetical protein DIU38_027585 [Mucilaginibacter gossypii]QTE43694.1 antibiotic biosynthesis monooxygenase [Mucilaginibacter rubeus]QTE50294.1 antibiotic biosynthesis monooxygenase [Mucilaginibacter rubeus]QTE55381.1 antibiotic biosynthesis monooxygenase [Mucilaginibacter rubeus]
MKNNKIVTHAELTIAPELIEEVLTQAILTKNLIQQEEGTEVFILSSKKDVPNVLVIFGVYTSEATYKWHLEQDYVKNFFAFLGDKLLAAPNASQLEEIV